jgi:hypothetical protein
MIFSPTTGFVRVPLPCLYDDIIHWNIALPVFPKEVL